MISRTAFLEPDDPDFEEKFQQLEQRGALFRVNHRSWWAEELPSEAEYLEARANLARVHWNVDYIISHCCPSSIQDVLAGLHHGGLPGDRTVLTAPEMQAILAGLRSLDSVSGTRRYAQLMEKLSAGTGALVPGGAHMLIDLSSWYKTSLPPKIELIQGAIEQYRAIRFAYFSPKEESVRIVEPCYLVFHWSAWYLWGWCRSRRISACSNSTA